ncbi:MAG: NAD(P)-dependent oxidoreductase [Phenylobacterium sp.]
MIQVLMSAAAHARIRDRIAPIAARLDIVTVAEGGRYLRDGVEADPATLTPEVVWTTLEAYAGGLLPSLMRVLIDSPSVRWLQTFNAGLDLPIFRRIMEKGVRITKSSAQGVGIAEYVLAHALALIVPIDAQRELQDAKTWGRTPYREVSQTRWLLVGYGAIGEQIAQRARAFGVDLTVVRRGTDAGLAHRTLPLSRIGEALPDTDVVVLACALTDETRDICNDAFFAALKPGAILINIGRGGLVDEDALRRGLDAGRPSHAVLDVFQTEPLPTDHWIWTHPQVRVSAHTSGSGDGVQPRADEQFIANLERWVRGEPLMNEAAPSEVGLP